MNSWDEEFYLRLFFNQYSRDHDDRFFVSIVQEHDDAFSELNSISSEEENVDQTKTSKTNNANDWFIWSR
jgi:NhaP-type Na+/H+ and K+/H+ antiporter